MATKKDYILVAGILEMNRSTFGASSISERNAINKNLDGVIDNFSREFAVDNPRFDSFRFKAAAGYGTYLGEGKPGSVGAAIGPPKKGVAV